MDHAWLTATLRAFVADIDLLGAIQRGDAHPSIEAGPVADRLVARDPVMREIMNAARPGFGDYMALEDTSYRAETPDYWQFHARHWALRAIGVHELGAEARKRLQPDSPDLVADQFHPWVWDAAAPLWYAGSRQEAVHAAGRSVNARIQQKLGRHDLADARLCREAFSLSDPAPGQSRLRFPGDRDSETWRSRQNGGIQFGAGCFEGIRNITAHVDGLDLTEQVALEQLASFSLLSRWIEECEVEPVEPPPLP